MSETSEANYCKKVALFGHVVYSSDIRGQLLYGSVPWASNATAVNTDDSTTEASESNYFTAGVC